MKKLDDETLVAYADGELDPSSALEVKTLLAQDAEARATLQRLRDSAELVKQAFDATLREPVPERLLKVLNAPPAGKVSAIHAARPDSNRRRWTSLALAATVALLVGAGSGYWAARLSAIGPLVGLPTVASDVQLNKALETVASGVVFAGRDATGLTREIVPRLTFRDAQGRFCREFEDALVSATDRRGGLGVACRDKEGGWTTEIRLSGRRVAVTGKLGEQEDYAPAAGDQPLDIGGIVRGLMAGEPLRPEEEVDWLKRGWR